MTVAAGATGNDAMGGIGYDAGHVRVFATTATNIVENNTKNTFTLFQIHLQIN